MAIMELRKKSQVTIPLELVSKMGLKPGDKMEAIEKDGGIFITPVVIYPKSEMKRIAKLIKEAEEAQPKVDAGLLIFLQRPRRKNQKVSSCLKNTEW